MIVRNRRLLPAGLLALAMWLVASLPGEDLHRIQTMPANNLLQIVLSDPFLHALTFGLLALLAARGAERSAVPLVRAALWTIGFGFLIELYQAALPWRSFGLDDLVWNATGVLLALALFRLGQSPRSARSKPSQGG